MRRPNRRIIVTLSLTLAAAFALSIAEYLKLPSSGSTTVRFLSIGQGDSALITGPSGQQILVDGGPDMRALEEIGRAMPFFDRTIDLLVLSHPHFDHVYAFPEILRRYNVKHVLLAGAVYDNGPYEEFLSILREQKTSLIIAEPNKDIDMGDSLMLRVLWPPPLYFGKTVKEIHDSCVAFKLIFGEDSILFTGDMEEKNEKKLLAAKIDVSADVLKVGHHGSKTSSGTGFLLAVHPQLAVISAGVGNVYRLPSPVIVRRIEQLGIPVRLTMSGTIVWKMDGK